jgi:predicted nucleic acid-binding protein
LEAASYQAATSCTTVPSFVDTNVLVYAEDRDAKHKHDVARDLVLGLWNDRQGVLSVQVLQEFYVTVTRKLKKSLRRTEALDIVREYLTWTVVENTGSLLVQAAELQQRSQLSFWDAMVVQAAIQAGCDRLYSEDLNAGQRFDSVTVVNPFKTTGG